MIPERRKDGKTEDEWPKPNGRDRGWCGWGTAVGRPGGGTEFFQPEL